MQLTDSRLRFVLVSLATSIALAACGAGNGEPPSNNLASESASEKTMVVSGVSISRNGFIGSRLEVRFEPFNAPFLIQLRERERLDEVVSQSPNEFGKMLALRDWVSSQWPQGNPAPYPPWNALEVLDWIRANYTGGFCGQYSQVLLQSLVSMGMTARYVEIGSTDNPYAHFVIEAWSNEFNKWVMLDADYNVHFERMGVPLSALEIHDALVSGQMSEVVAIPGEIRAGHSDPARWPLRTAELYYYVRFHLNANHLSAPLEPAFDRWSDMVEWTDAATVLWEQSTVPSLYPKVRLTNSTTGDRALVDGPLNQVVVTVDSWSSDQIALSFQNNVFGFDRYQIRQTDSDGRGGVWLDFNGDNHMWLPQAQRRAFEIRGVNSRGVVGPGSLVVAEMNQAN